MRKQKRRFTGLIVALGVLFAACRTSPPAPAPASTSTALPSDPPETAISGPTNPTPSQASDSSTPPAPTPIPTTTPTPLPTWPERWEPTGGPYGGFIETVAVHPTSPNTLYAGGTGGSVYTSTDGGETWSPGERLAPPHCPFSSLLIDASDSSIAYAANPCAGLFKSSDAGSTWSHLTGGVNDNIQMLAQSPHAPGLLLAADHNGQAFRSQDGAATWEPISDGLPGDPIRALVASGPDTYWATTANGRDGDLFRYGGGFWSAVPWGQPPDTETSSVLVDPGDPSFLYIGLESTQNTHLDPDHAYLYRSLDGGFNWSPVQSLPLGTETVAAIYLLGKGQRSGTLYVASHEGLLLSLDGGDTWEQIDLPGDALAPGDLRQIAIDPTDNDVLYLPTRGTGIIKSDDGGRTWRAINRGLDSLLISHVATHPTDPATLYAVPSGGASAFKSTDWGDSWTRLPGGNAGGGELTLDPLQPDTMYQTVDGARVLRSDDGGATWSVAWPEFRFSSVYSLVIAPSDPSILYANKNGFGLFRSDDNGDSWRFLPDSGVGDTYALALHPDNPDFVLSGDNREPLEQSVKLRRSRDGGDTWDVSMELSNADGITAVAFDPRVEPYFSRGNRPPDPTRLYAGSVGLRGALWFSNDAGDSWKPFNDALNFSNVDVLTVVPHRPGVVYAGLRGGGTWRTEDNGQSWGRLPGDPATSAAAIAVDPSNHNIIYIADGTTPHLYRSTDDGNNWELLFDAGADYARLGALALAPSDPTILLVSALKTFGDPAGGAVFRVDADAPPGENATDITNNLPGAPSSLAVHRRASHRIFAAVPNNGVWKTADDGASWRRLSYGLPDLPEMSFAQVAMDPIMPGTLFLTGSDVPDVERQGLDPNQVYGVWKSTDDGNTWSQVGGETFGRASGPIKSIAFHPDDQRIMYAAGEGGVFLSPDRGETWTGINGRLPFIPMNTIATDGQTLFAGSAGGGVFPGAIHPLIHTADWTPASHLNAPVGHVQITLHPGDPQALYASAFPGGIFKTSDGGATWHARNFGLPSFAVADPSRQAYALSIAPSAPETLFVGLYSQGVFRSDDGGASWYPVHGEQGELRGAGVQALLVHPDDPDVVYVATEHGIWRTVNGGQSWGDFSQGVSGTRDARTLALAGDGQLYVGGRGYGVYVRNAFHQAGDDTWWHLPELPLWDERPRYPYTSLLVQPSDSGTLFAGAFPGGIFKTTDGGDLWREINVGFEDAGALALVSHPTDTHVLYAGSTDGIARSTDGGATWHFWDAGWPPKQWVLSIAFDTSNPDVMYACSRNDGDEEKGADGTPSAGGAAMKSTDGGATWFEIATGLDLGQAFYQVLVDRFDPNIVYLLTERDGIFISRDGGSSWSSWNEGLWNRITSGDLDRDVLQLSADGRLLFLGTAGSGVWRRPAEGTP